MPSLMTFWRNKEGTLPIQEASLTVYDCRASDY